MAKRPGAFEFKEFPETIEEKCAQMCALRTFLTTHFPAFPNRADSGDSGMMAEPGASLEGMEFPKISINSGKIR